MSNTHCPRCSGLLVPETTVEDAKRYDMLRCPLCGFYTDAQMEANRRIATIPASRQPYGKMKGIRI